MKVTSDMVKDLQRRVDVTYEEAERMLLKTSGNIDRAEHLLNRRKASRSSRFFDEVNRLYRELLTYYFKITRKEAVLVNVPLLVVVGLFLVLTMDSKIWVGVITIGLILLSESDVAIYRVEVDDERIIRNDPKDEGPHGTRPKEPSYQASKAETMKAQDGDQPTSDGIDKKDDDDDYYEITIEK